MRYQTFVILIVIAIYLYLYVIVVSYQLSDIDTVLFLLQFEAVHGPVVKLFG